MKNEKVDGRENIFNPEFAETQGNTCPVCSSCSACTYCLITPTPDAELAAAGSLAGLFSW